MGAFSTPKGLRPTAQGLPATRGYPLGTARDGRDYFPKGGCAKIAAIAREEAAWRPVGSSEFGVAGEENSRAAVSLPRFSSMSSSRQGTSPVPVGPRTRASAGSATRRHVERPRLSVVDCGKSAEDHIHPSGVQAADDHARRLDQGAEASDIPLDQENIRTAGVLPGRRGMEHSPPANRRSLQSVSTSTIRKSITRRSTSSRSSSSSWSVTRFLGDERCSRD